MTSTHEQYMQRCIDLARLGAGAVAPNPMVGAVLVYEDRIIGEGWHRQYGQAHAEANCIASVTPEDVHLIERATLYVSLEPCAHFGKTPPCSDLIIANKIPRVVIGCRDSFEAVDGRGIEKLLQDGIDVITGILEKECLQLNARFFTFNQYKRPYIVLKWAQTADRKMAANGTERLLISNEYTNRLVHKWRSEEAAILVGTNTALIDDPSLDNRLYSGKSPVRMVIDSELSLPVSLKLFNRQQRTIVFNCVKQEAQHHLHYYRLKPETNLLPQIMEACYQLQLQSVLVEGGQALLQSFIRTGLWNEARIITNTELRVGDGLPAPDLTHAQLVGTDKIITDSIAYYTHQPAL